MQARSSGLLRSFLSRNLSYSQRNLKLVPSFARYCSTEANRASIAPRRTDDLPEEIFTRDLNIGNENTRNTVDKAELKPPSPIAGRPLRKERGMEGLHEDLFPDFNAKKHSMNRGRSNRPSLAGEGRGGSRMFLQKDKSEFKGNRESFDFFDKKSSDFYADKPKGEENSDGKIKNVDQNVGGDRIGESLFQKLKLGEIAGGGNVGESNKNARMGGAEAEQAPQPESPPEDADQIFKKMKETGLIPNAVSMLDGLCKDGLVQEAMKLFGLMREKGTIPEVVIYTAVVEGFCKAAKFDDAKRIFRKMQKNEIVPNAFSYAVLIQGLSKGKRVEDAIEFSFEMVDSGHSLNGATLTALVDVSCKEKGIKEAENLVRSLREKGYALDEKAIREYLDKKGPYSPMVWEAIFGKKISQRPF